MLGVMILTTYDIISEHDLFNPDSNIKNIGITSLVFLEFLGGEACDLDCEWGCEVVRLCDQVGIDLEKEVRKQVSVSKADIKKLRKSYQEKVKGYNFGDDDEKDEDAYKTFAEKEDWKPGDDWEDKGPYGPERCWYRWDWALEASFDTRGSGIKANNVHSIQHFRRTTRGEPIMILPSGARKSETSTQSERRRSAGGSKKMMILIGQLYRKDDFCICVMLAAVYQEAKVHLVFYKSND
jgi:hypothetical protein